MRLISIVLAAGSASRFGADKLSANLEGRALIEHAICTARAAPVEKVIVVTRAGLPIGNWPGKPPVERHAIRSDAMSTSLKAGIAAAAGADGVFIFLGDMPRVPHDIAGKLAKVLGGSGAAIARFQGKPGHPVLLSARIFPSIRQLTGDEGAGRLLKQREDIVSVECDDPGILLDIDRPADLQRLERGPADQA